MTRRAKAARHARALFEVSLEATDPRRVEEELQAFAALLGRHEALRTVLLHPAVPAPRKRALVAELLGKVGTVDQVVAKLLLLLAERDRLALLDDLIEAYHGRLMQHLEIVEARVTTAVPLSSERTVALERGLAKAIGKRVSLVTDVDPALIGGVVARVGSMVYDGSVTRQLERIKERLEQAV